MRETVKSVKSPYFSQVESPHFFDMRKSVTQQTSQNFMLAPSPIKSADPKIPENAISVATALENMVMPPIKD